MATSHTHPRTVTLPDPLKPPAATAPTDVVGLRVRGSSAEFALDARGVWWMVGRGPSADLRFADDTYMSSTHAVIHREPETGGLVITDRSTKGATFLNGVPCKSGYLHDGVRIQLGRTILLAYSADSRDVWTPMERLVGSSPAFGKARQRLMDAAESRAHVIFVGAAGAGKRTMAEALHQESPRAGGRFVEIDCQSRPASEVPTALAIAADAATNGTILLSHADELDTASLRALAGVLDAPRAEAARVVITVESADVTGSAAWTAIRERAFSITVPRLWERTLDIAALAKSFAREFGVRSLSLPAADIAALAGRDWPGEVAELRRAIGHAVVESKGTLDVSKLWTSDQAREEDLRIALMRAVAQAPSRRLAAEGLGLAWSTFGRLADRLGVEK